MFLQTPDNQNSGYAHPLYAASLAEYGTPRLLGGCRGWVLERQIPGSAYRDAMGLYPLFFCEEWEKLPGDIESLSDHLVAVSLVCGPFSTLPDHLYQEYFDIFKPYKEHYILDLSLPLETTIARGHRRNAARALRNLDVDVAAAPEINLEEWVSLYDELIKRHQIQGIRRFSRSSFEKQVSIPNTVYFRVLHQNKIVGGNIFFIQGDAAYAHLSAFTEEGYALGAPYAVKWAAVKYLSAKVHWVNFGGYAGSYQNSLTGLDYFKQGWSNMKKQSYFCGKILDKQKYDELVQLKQAFDTNWFPAYRQGSI